jgi:hypothetical protein
LASCSSLVSRFEGPWLAALTWMLIALLTVILATT